MQYGSFLDVQTNETVPVIFKTFNNRKVSLLSGIFNRHGFEELSDEAIFELVAIADFESLIVRGHWTPAGSHTLSGYPVDELSRRGHSYERRQELFRHALTLADIVTIGPEAIEAMKATQAA